MGTKGLEPLNPKELIYSQPQLPLCDTPNLVFSLPLNNHIASPMLLSDAYHISMERLLHWAGSQIRTDVSGLEDQSTNHCAIPANFPTWDSRWVNIYSFSFQKPNASYCLKSQHYGEEPCPHSFIPTRPAFYIVRMSGPIPYPLLNESWIKDYRVSLTRCGPGRNRTYYLLIMSQLL